MRTLNTEEFDLLVAKFQKEGLNAGQAYTKAKETTIGELNQVELLLDIRQLVKASLNLQASEAVSVRDPKWK